MDPLARAAVVAQLLADYDRLRGMYFDAIKAGDDLAEASTELISQAYAHRIPEYPVVEKAVRAVKSWRSAR